MTIDLFAQLIMCHFIGDYFLQIDFIAKTKGENIYHMIVHCVLYTIPFYFIFGLGWQLAVIFVSHIIVDLLKARWHKINYIADQCLHYLVIVALFLLNGMR